MYLKMLILWYKQVDRGPFIYYISHRELKLILVLYASAYGLGGLVQKKATFADVQYCIYADIVNGWVQKSPNMCWICP